MWFAVEPYLCSHEALWARGQVSQQPVKPTHECKMFHPHRGLTPPPGLLLCSHLSLSHSLSCLIHPSPPSSTGLHLSITSPPPSSSNLHLDLSLPFPPACYCASSLPSSVFCFISSQCIAGRSRARVFSPSVFCFWLTCSDVHARMRE